jgi:hypothetical protein
MDPLELELVAGAPMDPCDPDVPTGSRNLKLVADLVVPTDPHDPELELVVGNPFTPMAAPIQQGATDRRRTRSPPGHRIGREQGRNPDR